jgi:hypothetical protein
MQAAENLHEKNWGKDLSVILEEIYDHEEIPWKYVPKKHIDSLEMAQLGYYEKGLLVRAEYTAAFDELCPKAEKNGICRGVVVIGQPGIGILSLLFIDNAINCLLNANPGKTCFLYYLLLRLLSRRTPVALELPHCFLIFHDDGVNIHHLNMLNTDVFPRGTWALSDSFGSHERIMEPCSIFQTASLQKRAWLVQTTSPLEKRYKDWKKQCKAEMFVMDYCSINEIMALGFVLTWLQRVYCLLNLSLQQRTWPQGRRSPTQLRNVGSFGTHLRVVIR